MEVSGRIKPLVRLVAGVVLLSMTFFITLAAPLPQSPMAHAQFEKESSEGTTPYGGLNVFQIICTCSANVLLFIFDYATNKLLRLVYQPGLSKLYLNFNIFGKFLLGDYLKDVGQCRIQAGNTCVSISANGMLGFLPGTGTSN